MWGRRLAIGAVLAIVATGCGGSSGPSDANPVGEAPKDCTVIDLASSPEKIDLLNDLAKAFNDSSAAKQGGCVFVRPEKVSSGAAELALEKGWDTNTNGPKPVVWSPAASTWGALLNQRLADQGQSPMTSKADAIMVTPLTIAMPKPMAQALGWPDKPIGWSDILDLARNQQGWGAFGHPEWGPFRLGKTNPNLSTSGLNELIAQAYAATGKTDGLSSEDLAKPEVVDFATGVESAVVHYGDTTLTFLNNWYRADQRGTSLTYVSAVAVEEKSVIDFNQGNPDGILQPGEHPRPPRVPLVAIYPKEGTLYSDSPYFVLDAPWVTAKQKDGAAKFETFLRLPANQRRALQFHFRPGNPAVSIGSPITKANGVDPTQPQTLLEVPDPPVVSDLLDRWSEQRKKARVMLVLDVSGSMGDPADPDDDSGPTKLDLAKQAAIDSLDQFSPDDLVALRVFSTNLGDKEDENFLDLQPYGRAGDQAEKMKGSIRDLVPTNATPLYDVIDQSFDDAETGYDPDRINAIVVLTDGQNDDGDRDDDDKQLNQLLASLRSSTEGETAQPVRVFTIGYGRDADIDTLRRISEASNAAVYDASNAATISNVLTNVISNF